MVHRTPTWATSSLTYSLAQVGEAMPYIDELCLNLRAHISDLEPGQIHVFYEAVGYMVSAQTDAPTRDALLMKLMEVPNQMWLDILAHAKHSNGENLKDPDTMKRLQTIIRTNERVAVALGHPYTVQLQHIYVDLLAVYKVRSGAICAFPCFCPVERPLRISVLSPPPVLCV
jgi:exportin-1